ncbi:FAD dependent oxidoreductase [Beutenbergia cavernae DSM 12333]|uniref:FAD dependent oxidoreductase n=1 Tax=Beutenbergia cavernae (strain ATCC BAA-8 / DSM 12333 / CCUG 43141 / JCM 11478 / NBRC 16432 / NCIMB 13614 / HKI 0122) TaxID=471853 RepID=C5BVL9_BEUC1|nr:FAD-dependent oxidoreductase [Beutenbergia cavernae]ACQ78459.1 FAD dependent oxidoreductase [Beutenbergia cavernae DSM 12333]
MELRADVAVIGGGLGGVSAALAALQAGRRVVITDPTRWLGGQLTSQLVPSDEHRYIEDDGANRSYRDFRDALREYYRRHYPLTDAARADPHLNPGHAWVSPVSLDPRVAVAVIDDLLAPYRSSDRLVVLMETEPVEVATDGDLVTGVVVRSASGELTSITAPYYLDATELGDLLELGGVEHRSGRESREQTGEPGAADTADPTDMQGVSWCFAIDHLEGEDHTIERPDDYAYWRDLRPPQLGGRHILGWGDPVKADGSPGRRWAFTPNLDDDEIDLDHRNMGLAPELWNYRRIAARRNFTPGFYRSDVVVVNWPMNDYVGGALFGVPDAQQHWDGAKALSRSLLYWLQTDAPRADGGTGWPGMRLRGDVAGTDDGFAMYPYIRESRRILALKTIVEQEVSTAFRGDGGAERYPDTVGVGHYYWIDRHATTVRGTSPGGTPHPFEIPLRSLIPQRVRNLLPACKNIGTTQITNGCYRLHPVEWSIGEAVGALAAHCLDTGTEPHAVAGDDDGVAAFQRVLTACGVQLRWDETKRW